MIKKQRSKKDDTVKVTFVLPGNHPYGDVSVVGDFNSWDPTSHPFARRSNKTYSIAVMLDAGKRYRFRYFSQNGQWINDDSADDFERNDFGSEDCVLIT